MTVLNQSPEDRQARTVWLRDRLLYAIQFHMWSDATAKEVEEVIESLSDSDEYDPNVAALVQMPKWCPPCEAQLGVDAFFASSQTLPAPGEVERVAAAIFEARQPGSNVDPRWSEWVAYAEAHPAHQPSVELVRLQATAAVEALATVAAANDEGVLQMDREAFARLDDHEPGSMGWRMITEPSAGDCVGVHAFAAHRRAAIALATSGAQHEGAGR